MEEEVLLLPTGVPSLSPGIISSAVVVAAVGDGAAATNDEGGE